MDDDSQIRVPPSFVALKVRPGSIRPAVPWPDVVERYELCEDLAQALTGQARDKRHDLGITETDVLERVRAGLEAGGLVDRAEAGWVLRRLAELLEWPALAPRADG